MFPLFPRQHAVFFSTARLLVFRPLIKVNVDHRHKFRHIESGQVKLKRSIFYQDDRTNGAAARLLGRKKKAPAASGSGDKGSAGGHVKVPPSPTPAIKDPRPKIPPLNRLPRRHERTVFGIIIQPKYIAFLVTTAIDPKTEDGGKRNHTELDRHLPIKPK